jgi:hypothetical protein
MRVLHHKGSSFAEMLNGPANEGFADSVSQSKGTAPD